MEKNYIIIKIRIWDQISFHHLINISDPNVPIKRNSITTSPGITCLSFSNDGQKLLASDESGKIFCWDARNISQKNILISSVKVSEIGVISLAWLNYFGEQNSHKLLCYTGEGSIKILSLKINMGYSNSRSLNQGNMGKFYDVREIWKLENEVHSVNLKNYNLGLSKYLQIHNNCNMICCVNLKIKVVNVPNVATHASNINFSVNLKMMGIFDKLHPTSDYPVILFYFKFNKNLDFF